MAIRFYKEFGELGYLASYSNYGFFKEGIYWKTIEHYYQAHKFEDHNIIEKVINAETPKVASEIGRDRSYSIKEDWEEIKVDIMYDAVLAKFMAHPDLAKKLMDTGNEEIIEETVKEDFWGCGLEKNGKNMYGKILCKVRDELRKSKYCSGEEE